MLLTTQYLEEADRLADSIVVLDQGRVIATGTAEQLKAQVGGDRLELRAPPGDGPARHWPPPWPGSAPAEPTVDPDDGRVVMPVADGPAILPDVAARLAAAGLRVSDLALRRPASTTCSSPSPASRSRTVHKRTPLPQGGRDDHDRRSQLAGYAWPARAGWLANVATITGRNLRRLVRVPTLIAFATVQPVLFVLLFTYALGGAIHPPGVTRYIDYALPGICVLAIAFGASQTGVAIADDLATGMIDRFRALPMTRSAVLAGRTAADAVRNLFVLALMTGVAHRDRVPLPRRPAAALAAVGLAVAGRGRVLVDLRAARAAGPRPRIGRHRRAARRHPADLHQLHLRAGGHVPRLAAGVRQGQPDHGHRRRAARAVPGRADRHPGVAGPGLDRRAARRHRPRRRPPLPADHRPHEHRTPTPPQSYGEIMTSDPVDVLVVGAGPTGLSLAAALAAHGVGPRLIDRAP